MHTPGVKAGVEMEQVLLACKSSGLEGKTGRLAHTS